MINADLMQRVLKQIEEHPETWDQKVWLSTEADCGTAACFAGWACLLSGYSTHQWPFKVVSTSGAIRNVSIVARELLGLDEDDGGRLFACDNTLDGLRCLVNEFTQRAEVAG